MTGDSRHESDPELDPNSILFGALAPGVDRQAREVRPDRRRASSLLPPLDRFRVLQRGNGKKFCYSTDAFEHPEDHHPRWYSWVEKPVGPGARTGKAKHWELVEKTVRSHHRPSRAKGRAIELYEEDLAK